MQSVGATRQQRGERQRPGAAAAHGFDLTLHALRGQRYHGVAPQVDFKENVEGIIGHFSFKR
jgi:hypothetical protein